MPISFKLNAFEKCIKNEKNEKHFEKKWNNNVFGDND